METNKSFLIMWEDQPPLDKPYSGVGMIDNKLVYFKMMKEDLYHLYVLSTDSMEKVTAEHDRFIKEWLYT